MSITTQELIKNLHALHFRISPSTTPPPIVVQLSFSIPFIPSTIPSSSWWFITKAYLLLHPFQRAKSTGVACISQRSSRFWARPSHFWNLVTQKKNRIALTCCAFVRTGVENRRLCGTIVDCLGSWTIDISPPIVYTTRWLEVAVSYDGSKATLSDV